MARILSICLVVWSVVLLASCFDPEPGEISVRCKKNGRMTGAAVLVFNSDGQQIQLVPTDLNGLLYIKLPPGKYTLKFQAIDGTPYQVEKVVNLQANGSEVVDVDLNEVTAAPE